MSHGGIEQLTDREKRVLRLLASGHSVKSAAAEEAITENAANELLRSARRKLGTGSSREAARRLAEHEGGPQKIRDENPVVPRAPAGVQHRPWFTKGMLVMIVTALFASAAFVLLSSQDSGRSRDAAPPAVARGPRVVATTPANGARIKPGPFRLSVTFDRRMAPGSYSFSHDAAEAPFPECSGAPQLSPDGRTYTMACTAKPGARHVVYFNRPPYTAFMDAATRMPAEMARLEFTVAER